MRKEKFGLEFALKRVCDLVFMFKIFASEGVSLTLIEVVNTFTNKTN